MKTTFVLFWATGDLAKRKLFPALYKMHSGKKDSDLNIVSLGRRDFDDAGFREFISEETEEFLEKKEDFSIFLDSVKYLKLELENKEDYRSLEKYLMQHRKTDSQVIFYLAISPEYFSSFIDNCKGLDFGNMKVIFEKPFGTDLSTSRELNDKIMEAFNEEQVYRIDHYIGKEAVQNIFDFRFANTIYEAIWNNKYVDNIQITASESIGVGDRRGYYDHFWALRDMLQNHLFQVLSLVVMDMPKELTADAIRNEKLEVFKNIELSPDFENQVIFGQYEGYLNEKWVSEKSRTETFVALKVHTENGIFAWVPIYIRTGKYMSKKSTRIVIEFKEVPEMLMKRYGHVERNRIIIEVQPNESIDIHFNTRQSGELWEIKRVSSKFTSEMESKEAYQKLLEDTIIGDKTLFTSWEMLEETWRIVDDLVHCGLNCPIIYPYPKGTDGPEINNALLERDNRKWYE